MTRERPSFPPDVARALQRPEGRVSVCYTWPEPLADEPRDMDRVLMETPYQEVLAALVLDTKLNLRFIRTGSKAEGARVALVDVSRLAGAGRHWDIEMRWGSDEMAVRVRDQHDPGSPLLEGRWP